MSAEARHSHLRAATKPLFCVVAIIACGVEPSLGSATAPIDVVAIAVDPPLERVLARRSRLPQDLEPDLAWKCFRSRTTSPMMRRRMPFRSAYVVEGACHMPGPGFGSTVRTETLRGADSTGCLGLVSILSSFRSLMVPRGDGNRPSCRQDAGKSGLSNKNRCRGYLWRGDTGSRT